MTESSSEGTIDSRPRLPGGRWHLQLLGGLRARNGDIEIVFPSRAVTLLLARLALSPRSVHPRDELAVLLTPPRDPSGGGGPDDGAPRHLADPRKRLNSALSTLRSLLNTTGGAQMVLSDRYTVQLNDLHFDIDVERFLDCVVRRDARGARALYRGDLLPGIRGQWVDEARDELRRRYDDIDDWPAAASLDGADGAGHGQRLPAPESGFFGRGDEIEQLAALLGARRLVTVTGPPGSGKTRLAMAAADRLTGFDVRVFATLADHTDANQMADALRAAMQLPACGTPALKQVSARLAGRPALLVLDNFEHLVGAAADRSLAELLAALPDARLLLTSRRALRPGDPGELMLAPLPVPDVDADFASASGNPAVALFVNRARAVRAEFHLHRRNIAGVVTVCRAVDGMPFAIALAAAQVRVRSPDKIGQGLLNRLGTLKRHGRRAGGDGRHTSIEAALAGSWRLLDSQQRAALRALTVFRGGWTEIQARALIGDGARAALAVLVGDSLVQRAASVDGHARCELLTVVREFACERMSAGEAAALRSRHRQHFLEVAAELASRRARADDADSANFIAAMDTALADGDAATAVRIALNLEAHWSASGASDQALRVLRQVVSADTGAGPRDVVALNGLLAHLSVVAGCGSEGLDAARAAMDAAAGDDGLRAHALLIDSHARWLCDRDGGRALPPASEALRLARLTGQAALQARVLLLLGALALTHEKDASRAARQFEEAERIFTAIGDHRASVLALPGRTACLMVQGKHAEAIAVARAGAEHTWQVGDVVTHLLLLCRLSVCWESQRRFDQVVEICQRQTRIAQRYGLTYHLGFGVWNQCRALARLRRPQAAIRLLAFVCALWPRSIGPLDAEDQAYVRRVRRLACVQLGAANTQVLWDEGTELPLIDGIRLASGDLDTRTNPEIPFSQSKNGRSLEADRKMTCWSRPLSTAPRRNQPGWENTS